MAITRQQRILLIGGLGIAGVGIVGVAYEKNKKAKAAAATAAATTAATSQYAYGYGAAAGYGYGAYDQSLQYQPEVYGYGLGYYGYGSIGGTVTAPAATTNAMWSQAAVNQLTAQGTSGADAQAALGVYLTGGFLTPTQESIVQSAIAVEGYPPQSGASGYPPQMNVSGTGGGGTGGGQTGTGVTTTQKSYTTTGGKSLTQIASSLGTTPESIVSDTTSGHGNINGGKLWAYVDNWNTPIPAGLTLFYTPGGSA